MLADPATNDFTPGAATLGVGATPDPVFALFEGLYGLSIARDLEGTPRPSGEGFTIGAIELE